MWEAAPRADAGAQHGERAWAGGVCCAAWEVAAQAGLARATTRHWAEVLLRGGGGRTGRRRRLPARLLLHGDVAGWPHKASVAALAAATRIKISRKIYVCYESSSSAVHLISLILF